MSAMIYRDCQKREKSAAKDALSYLRILLGERFLERNYDLRRNADRHVIGNLILNGVAHTRMNLVRYMEALRTLKDSKNCDKLLNRFKKPDLFHEDESVLQVALEFSRAGFGIEFDPQIPIASPSGVVKNKRPDLLVTNKAGESAIVEVSRLRQNKKWTKILKDSDPIFNFFSIRCFATGLEVYARMTEQLTSSRVAETISHLEQLVEKVKSTEKLGTLVTDCIEVGIAPANNKMGLEEWAGKREISSGITGPPLESDEIARLIEKIKTKLAQLSENFPGIVVIPATESGLFFFTPFELIVEALTREIVSFPKLFCLVVTSRFFGGDDLSYATSSKEYAYVHRVEKGLIE
jgi:hypothetical protein